MFSGKMVESYSNLEAWLHDRLAAERALNLHAHFFEQAKLVDVFAEKRDRNVLDVGCGGGQTVLLLKKRYPHLRLTGIDLSESLIARARQRAQRRASSVQFEVANAQALPFPDQSFDIVFSLGSVKHWPDPLQGIAECWRVLKPGGELLLTDATSDATHEQVLSFYRLARFPSLLERPVTTFLDRLMFRPARPLETYEQIAAQLKMPPGTVTLPPDLPVFLFRTQKPVRSDAVQNIL